MRTVQNSFTATGSQQILLGLVAKCWSYPGKIIITSSSSPSSSASTSGRLSCQALEKIKTGMDFLCTSRSVMPYHIAFRTVMSQLCINTVLTGQNKVIGCELFDDFFWGYYMVTDGCSCCVYFFHCTTNYSDTTEGPNGRHLPGVQTLISLPNLCNK